MQKRIAKYGVAIDHNSELNADKKTYHVIGVESIDKKGAACGCSVCCGRDLSSLDFGSNPLETPAAIMATS